MNNYYLEFEISFNTRKHGHNGKFMYRETIYHKYMNDERVENVTKDIMKALKETDGCVDVAINNLDWTGQPIGICRLFVDFHGIRYISWTDNEYGKRNEIDDRIVANRGIRPLVKSIIERFDRYVKIQKRGN